MLKQNNQKDIVTKDNKNVNPDYYTRPQLKTEENKVLFDLIKFAGENPKIVNLATCYEISRKDLKQTVELCNKLKDTKLANETIDDIVTTLNHLEKDFKLNITPDLFTKAIEFVEKTNDKNLLHNICKTRCYESVLTNIFSNVSENNVEFLKNIVNKGKIDIKGYIAYNMAKNIEEFKNPENWDRISNYANEICPNIRYVDYYSGLLDMKVGAPDKYEKIVKSGMLDFMKQKNGLLLKHLNRNSNIIPEAFNDLVKLKSGESIIPKFNTNTDLQDVFNNTKIGDAVAVGSKMYINDGKQMYEWNMTEEKYLELFPPVIRYMSQQRGLGNCYLVSSINACMNNPIARANLYKSFRQNGNDIVVTVNAYNEYGGTHTFKDSNIELDKYNQHITGCKGIQMIEQTYAHSAFRDYTLDPLVNFDETLSNYSMMQRIKSGQEHIAMSELLGLKNLGWIKSIPKDFHKVTCGITLNPKAPKAIEILKKYLQQYANDDNFILHFGGQYTKDEIAEAHYNIIPTHGYEIKGYNSETEIVQIINPHNCSVYTEVPISELTKYVTHMSITSLN